MAQTITEQSDVVMSIPTVGPVPYGLVPMYNVPLWLLYEPCPFMVVADPPPLPEAPEPVDEIVRGIQERIERKIRSCP